MKLNSLFFLILTACTTALRPQDRYEVIDKLWKDKATRVQVIENLGPSYEKINDGIIYRITGYKEIESGHFFDPSGRLTEQFLFVYKENFEKAKKLIACEWDEKSEMKAMGHTVHTINSGKCDSKNISYEYRPSMLSYEFRWKSN